MARFNPGKFIAEVRSETSKVVWPTRRETALTTVMVFILSALAAVFFFIVDWFLAQGVQAVLSGAF
ncbi:MAG: preprotein translocase subunit SecE [Pseudomonadota bacterium]